MNLANDPWIPARRLSGVRETIAPWQVTAGIDSDPVVALDFPRPDFNTAVIQFLVGLLQTACPPESESAWGKAYDAPPEPGALGEAFGGFHDCFQLDGDGPRFMQDFEPLEAEAKPIGGLLIEV